MWYGFEVKPSFDCEIEVMTKEGKTTLMTFERNGRYEFGTGVVKWRFTNDINYFRGQRTTEYFQQFPDITTKYTIKHLENENNYLNNEVRILKERINETENK